MLMEDKQNSKNRISKLIINIGAFTTVPVIYGLGTNLSKKYQNIPIFIGTVALSIAAPIMIKKISKKIIDKNKKNKEE